MHCAFHAHMTLLDVGGQKRTVPGRIIVIISLATSALIALQDPCLLQMAQLVVGCFHHPPRCHLRENLLKFCSASLS